METSKLTEIYYRVKAPFLAAEPNNRKTTVINLRVVNSEYKEFNVKQNKFLKLMNV
jgi:hypothetical protein